MERRSFLKWFSFALISLGLLFINLIKKISEYIIGPKLTPNQEAKLIEEKIKNLERSLTLDKLREERLLKNKIFICEVKDLRKKEGFSFVDFNVKPALAFKGNDGNPVLISSVCTHLGCTVQNKLTKGKLLCPCHISYFELETGKALEGPAKVPLPMIPYIIEDEKVYIIKNV